jgi:hypothetical protein
MDGESFFRILTSVKCTHCGSNYWAVKSNNVILVDFS